MNKLGMSVLLLCILLQSTPLSAIIQFNSENLIKYQVRVLSESDMINVNGAGGGGGSKGMSTNPITDKKISGIPYINQHVVDYWNSKEYVNGVKAGTRSNYYCGLACASMISAWNNPYQSWVGDTDSEEYHMILLDNMACDGTYAGVDIDVYTEHGYMYSRNYSDYYNMRDSRNSLKSLYANETERTLSTYVDYSPSTAFSKLWDHVEDRNKPGVFVTKAGNSNLHYVLCTGIRKSNGTEYIYKNDPADNRYSGGKYLKVTKTKFKTITAISNYGSGYYGWAGDYQNGNSIFGKIF